MKVKSAYVGKWRITEMSEWDREFIDRVAPGHLTLKSNGTGVLAFGAIEAEIDCRIEKRGRSERLDFSFRGWDEGDEISGGGWATVTGDNMEGWLAFHLGDESTFKGLRQRTKLAPTNGGGRPVAYAEMSGLEYREEMEGEPHSGFFRDDGTEINPDLIPKPSLCDSCRKDNDPDEKILCTLTRADHEEDAEFRCFAFEPKH